MQFLNEDHALNFQKMVMQDQTNFGDTERVSLFYIMSASNDLYEKRNHIYDFNDHSIKPEVLTESTVDLCSGHSALIRLGFNLYNGYEDKTTNPRDIFKNLDQTNHFVAMQAMQLSFGRSLSSAVEETQDHEDVEQDCKI